jgi:ankyrin repeat protein
MQALARGANPNVLSVLGDPIAFTALLQANTVFLTMLLESKSFNLKATVNDDQGRAHPLLLWAIAKNKPDHAQLLLDAGCDPNALNVFGSPIAWTAVLVDNTAFLKMLIDKGLNLSVTIMHGGKMLSVADFARIKGRVAHLKMIEEAIVK